MPGKAEAMDRLMQVDRQRLASEMQHDLEGMLAQGMGVGSGSTESMGGAMTRRLKLRGLRWDRDNAEAMRTLEAPEPMDGGSAWLDTVPAQ